MSYYRNTDIHMWCIEQELDTNGDKIEALLMKLSGDLDEIKEWDIKIDGDYIVYINDTEYEIYNEEEMDSIRKDYAEMYVNDMIDMAQVPDYLINYINKDDYIYDTFEYTDPRDVCEGCEEFMFNDNLYYVVEL